MFTFVDYGLANAGHRNYFALFSVWCEH